MKNKLQIGLAIIAGGVLFNIPWAFSNAPSTEEVLSRAMAGAMQQVADYQQKREDDELNKLPNIMDCQNMQWMKNCTEVNKQAKKNPTAPIRVTNAKGIEFNFVPGTPSAVIRLQLEQTPEAAMNAVQYMNSTWGEYNKSAKLYQNAMWEAGPMDNIIGLDRAKAKFDAPKAVNQKSIALSVFVHSMCGACEVQLTTLAKLQERYPELKITVFQFDDNEAGFKAKVTDKGLKGRMLDALEARNALKAGVDKWPTTWIDNVPLKQRQSLAGVRTIVQLEESLQGITHILEAKK
uniref:Thioredoxin domain-containing protein n=1 Tax=Pseudomonas fluorescens (strain SBW25) TaxID=216595 RepID=A0A0G4E4K6_PSEFS|nr:hypothetical protein [Pseudomonas fluorescens]CEK42171.1 hypothetical protein PQBR57_0218 [Pseudomonas fluorescens SBW25]